MDKDGLLKSIAETGYNVGFGAKKHFATYEVAENIPGWITFFSLAFGILGLAVDQLAQKVPAAILAVIGVAGLYVSAYDSQKSSYEETGKKLTNIFYELRDLYRSVQSGSDPAAAHIRLNELQKDYFSASISKQTFLADWMAHYKFFWQMQIDWIDEQKKFQFFRDKIPLSFMVTCAALFFAASVAVIAFNLPQRSKAAICAPAQVHTEPQKPVPAPLSEPAIARPGNPDQKG